MTHISPMDEKVTAVRFSRRIRFYFLLKKSDIFFTGKKNHPLRGVGEDLPYNYPEARKFSCNKLQKKKSQIIFLQRQKKKILLQQKKKKILLQQQKKKLG